MIEYRAASLAATHALAAAIARLSRSGDVIVLAGEMGSGKTAFAQGFGVALGVTEPITSPTFTLVHSYQGAGKVTLYHADLYRLDQLAEVTDLALDELAELHGIVLVEWGDVADSVLGDHLEVRLRLPDELPDDGVETEVRLITLTPSGSGWAQRWQQVAAAVAQVDLC